jgi:hypothetical protein
MLAFLVFLSLGPSPKGEREREREKALGALEVDLSTESILGFFCSADFRI